MFSQAKNLLKPYLRGVFGFLKKHKPGHLEVTIKFTWVRVIIGFGLLMNFWPHISHIQAQGAAESGIQVVKIAPMKPIEAVKYAVPSELKQKYIPPPEPVYSASTGYCGDNTYKQYIYQHESGCNTLAKNWLGCLGVGQACPGSKLLASCPNLDFGCQDAFFSAYAVSVYGSWYQAYLFWARNHWW